MTIKYALHLNNIERMRGAYPSPDTIRLNSAERTSEIPQIIWNKYIDSLRETDIRYYPDIDHAINVIAKHTQQRAEYITLGHGSDSLIKNAFEVFAKDTIGYTNIVIPDPCFVMYNIYADMMKCSVNKVAYKDKKFDVQGTIDAINIDTSLVVLSNPNSPIGDSISIPDLLSIIKKAAECKCVVLIDEAYIEFSSVESFVSRAHLHDNVIVTRTFSKAVGAAGIRFGYAVANSRIIELLNKVKNMYEITGPTLKWIETIVDNWGMVEVYVNQIKAKRSILAHELEKDYNVLSSECNWIHTTKTDFDDSITTRQCKLPWDDRIWTRLCIPADRYTLERLV